MEHRDTHPHSAGNKPGGYQDQTDRPDGGLGAGGIGHAKGHFSSPIHSMTTHHDVIPCPSCGAGILWNRTPVSFLCQGCGVTVDGKALSGQ